jgi:hypothetical protein
MMTGTLYRHFAAIATSMLSPFIEECTMSASTGRTANGRSMCWSNQAASTASANVRPSP